MPTSGRRAPRAAPLSSNFWGAPRSSPPSDSKLGARLMPRIVVLDGHTLSPGDLSFEELAKLGELEVFERTPPELLLARSQNADVLVTNKTVITEATIAALPNLRGIAVLATGVNVVDVAAARARGIPVSNVPGYSTTSVAEHTLALLFELTRHVGL